MNPADLDLNTLFLVTMHVEIMLALLLFFAWTQSYSKRALAWWGSAHLMRAVSILLFGTFGSAPDWIAIDLANAVLFCSFALTWSGARVFDRRQPALREQIGKGLVALQHGRRFRQTGEHVRDEPE